MNNRAIAIIMVAAAFGGDCHLPLPARKTPSAELRSKLRLPPRRSKRPLAARRSQFPLPARFWPTQPHPVVAIAPQASIGCRARHHH